MNLEHSYPKPERTNYVIIASRTYFKSGLINSSLPHSADTGLKFPPANLCKKFACGFAHDKNTENKSFHGGAATKTDG